MSLLPQGRSVRRLTLATVLGGAGQSLSGAAGALLAQRLGHGSGVAGLPQALLVAGAAMATLGISRLTARWGRGRALAAGSVVAAGGAALVITGAAAASLVPALAGSLLLGAGQASVMLGRYAAAELVPPAERARAMGRLLTATTVGAVAGPNLLAPTNTLGRTLGLAALAGPYAVSLLVFVVAAVVLRGGPAGGRTADPDTADGPSAPRSGWTSRGRAGLIVLSVANLVMVAVMTMAPLRMHDFGTGLGLIGFVISLHIAGMFVPSALSGWATDRFGAPRVAALAAALLVGACCWAATAGSTPAMIGSMALLGIGWNVALLSGSALLTADVPERSRPAREGWGDVGMGVAAAGGGAASGVVMSGSGYPTLGLGAAVIAAVLIPAVVSVRHHPGDTVATQRRGTLLGSTALIVVDMQTAFVAPRGGAVAERAERVVDEVNRRVASAADRGEPVFYTRDVQPTELPPDDPHRQTALAKGLDVRGSVVDKGPGKDGGMSGFVLAHSCLGAGGLSELAAALRAAAVDAVTVVGLAADMCVAATARDALRLGYDVTVDLAAGAFVHAHPDGDGAAVAELRAAGITVVG